MRVNVYAEEMTDRLEIISKEIEGQQFTGLRMYLELPVTMPDGQQAAGPFMHHPGDDDSAAVTFWGKRDLRDVLRKALAMLDAHYMMQRPRLESQVTISINGVDHPTVLSIWSYEMVANSAGLDPTRIYSATFVNANQSKTEGMLSPGGYVIVGPKTRFSIFDTGNA